MPKSAISVLLSSQRRSETKQKKRKESKKQGKGEERRNAHPQLTVADFGHLSELLQRLHLGIDVVAVQLGQEGLWVPLAARGGEARALQCVEEEQERKGSTNKRQTTYTPLARMVQSIPFFQSQVLFTPHSTVRATTTQNAAPHSDGAL